MKRITIFKFLLPVLIFSVTALFAQPTLTSPADGDTGVSIQPTFQWSAGSNTEKFQIASDNGFTNLVLDKTFNASETSYTLTESEKLDNNSIYYWRVSLDGGTTWSSTFSFTTIAAVSVTLGWPSNNATVYNSSYTYFSWYAYSSTSLKYKVQVTSSTSGGNADWSVAPDFETTTSAIYHTFSLLQGKTYYWRVIVLDSSDEVISYSSEYQFTTAGGAEVPTLSYPVSGEAVYINPPTFYWYIQSLGSDITYDIQVSTVNNFATTELDVQNINALYYTPSSAFSSGTLYWRVRSVYMRGTADVATSSWSAVESFVINSTSNLSTPQLSYPTDGVTVYTTSPYLYWYLNNATTGITFDVYYKESTAGSYTKANGADITNLYFQLTGLTAGKTYNWYVVAKEGANTETSATESFVVYAASSGSPVASYPTNGETVYSLRPSVYWYLNGSSTGLTKYTVRWKADNNSSDWDSDYDGQADVTPLTTTYYTFASDLVYGKTYYWAVAAHDGNNYGNWSSGSFVVYGNSLVAPTLSYPIGGATVYSTSVTLYWYLNGSYTGVQGYEVHYSKDGFTTNDVTVSPNPTTNSVTLTGLTPGVTYSWKVKTYYGNSTYSGFSATETFVVNAGAAPVQPLVGGPNNVTINNDSPTISWVLPINSESSLTYELEYSTQPDFSNATVVDGINTPFNQIQGLTAGETYYWRTRSKTSGGDYSDYSPTAHFTLDNVTDVSEETIPRKFEVWQNYPNPFNPSTVIKFALPSKMNTKVTVYDILGREVVQLLNETLEAGVHKVTFNTTEFNLSTGIYFYKIQAGDNVSIRKMILLK